MSLFWASTAETAPEARNEFIGLLTHQAKVEREKKLPESEAVARKLDELASFVRNIRYVPDMGKTNGK